jgi:hypothetical protein
MPGFNEAIMKRPPHASTDATADGVQAAQRHTSFTAANAFDDVLNFAVPATGCWITWVATADCWLHFYSSNAATPIAASPTVSKFLIAGAELDYFHIPRRDDKVAVIRSTADGVLCRNLSMH